MTAHDRIAALPIWRGSVEIEPLEGGITNTNFRVRDRDRQAVVRLCEDIPEHQILRRNELAASLAAHAAGIAPAVLHAEEGILVLEFIEGRTFSPEDVRAELARVVPLVRACHEEVPKFLRGPAPIFWVFHVVRDYAHTLHDGGSPYASTLSDLLHLAERLERLTGEVRIVFGHNDLLAANLLDDGERLWLIDWEYAGFNTPLFDIGGLASNNEIDPETVAELYFGEKLDDAMRLRLAATTAASLLRETMWSMVSELHSKLDFDYAAYTAENRRRLDEAVRSLDELTGS